MHTRARDNALMNGRWNQRMKIMSQGVGICFRIPKSLRLAYVSLHSAHHTYARQKTREWTVLSFPLSGQSTRKVKMLKKCLATTPPLYLTTYAKANQADIDKTAPLCRKHEQSLPQHVARVRKAWRAQFNSFDNQLKAPKGLCGG